MRWAGRCGLSVRRRRGWGSTSVTVCVVCSPDLKLKEEDPAAIDAVTRRCRDPMALVEELKGEAWGENEWM